MNKAGPRTLPCGTPTPLDTLKKENNFKVAI